MPTPTPKGQYRKVRYTDDGCTIYQCLWCLGTLETRDDPHYGWNFCPKCGKSWFNRLQCRDHDIPRWYYERWGNGDDPNAPSVYEMYPPRPQSTATWIIECRTKWFNDPWGEWTHEYSFDKDPNKPDWQSARWHLVHCRSRHDYGDDHDQVKFEYRARLERKKNLTFVIPDVDSSESNIVRNLLFKYGRNR